jgi:hypothetical protein
MQPVLSIPPADVGLAGNRGSIFPQYIPYFIAVVALPSKIDNSFSGLQAGAACAIPGHAVAGQVNRDWGVAGSGGKSSRSSDERTRDKGKSL